ncbi:hypothetical protein E4191_02770 [Paracoccus liaowanqingii]|uniref:Uncharacterized protein n=1 Tax=Paracoccus liaowanqingii TaxID=2560053 RepID=A0A4P7HJI5_9RHOB|nr:DUF6635 family protein [Paracoccus liaowanqingii]QBX33760.1 hypothetical protein E4191_02770 [Paracoccus liaowanqingii]
MPPAPLRTRQSRRDAALGRFAARRYGLRGTWSLHRHALGADLLRAPLNVMLAPVALLMQLMAWVLGRLGAARAGAWLRSRRVFLRSDVSRQIEDDLGALITQLQAEGLGPDAAPAQIETALRRHAETRNAVAEITTSLIVLGMGLALFHRATPGMISLAGPMAQMRAHGAAVRDFALGDTLGRAWYWAFPVEISPLAIVATGLALAVVGSLITTFAGLIADPVQLWTGIHRRRLSRLMAGLDRGTDSTAPEPEHLMARAGDLADTLSIIWRSWRG